MRIWVLVFPSVHWQQGKGHLPKGWVGKVRGLGDGLTLVMVALNSAERIMVCLYKASYGHHVDLSAESLLWVIFDIWIIFALLEFIFLKHVLCITRLNYGIRLITSAIKLHLLTSLNIPKEIRSLYLTVVSNVFTTIQCATYPIGTKPNQKNKWNAFTWKTMTDPWESMIYQSNTMKQKMGGDWSPPTT